MIVYVDLCNLGFEQLSTYSWDFTGSYLVSTMTIKCVFVLLSVES